MADIVEKIREKYKKDSNYWSEIYERAKEDLFFLSDDPYAQWDSRDYNERQTTGRPTLTVDQLSQFVHQVANDIRQNTPTINVIPADSDTDNETAEVIKGLIKNIEYESNADDVYDTAVLSAVRSGIGFIRIDHDYADDQSFHQNLYIHRVVNPFNCWIDADSIECDGRDAKHGTITEKITVAEFKRRFPGKEVVCFEADESGYAREKKDDDYVTIAEHFALREEEKTIAVDEMGNIFEAEEGAEYQQTRKIKKTTVVRYKLSGKEILEETTFPGKYIPLIPVYGEEMWIDGKRKLLSLIRRAKDAQKNYNYWKSLETEILQKQPNAAYMAAAGQVDEFSDEWADPAKSVVVRYKSTDTNGNPLQPPIRMEPPILPAGVVNAGMRAVDDIKATIGMYNASIGARSNETSGIAIQRRQQEGDVATFHFADNLVRSITQVGRVLVCAIPEIYDAARVLRIIGMEDETKTIGVNGVAAEGQERPFDLTRGKYDVRVVAGGSYTTRRQEAAQFFTDLVTRSPDMMMVIGDLMFKSMDFSGAHAMAERMKKIISKQSPEIVDDEENPEAQQMAQLTQQLQAMAAENQALQDRIKSKEQEQQVKYQIETQAQQLELEKLRVESQLQAAELEIKREELRLKQLELQVQMQGLTRQQFVQQDKSLGTIASAT